MIGDAAALAEIRAAFADLEPAIYVQSNRGPLPPLSVIRTDLAGPAFRGEGSTSRQIIYEVDQADLAEEPTKRDRLIHRGRVWAFEDITRRDDIAAWELIVSDEGPWA